MKMKKLGMSLSFLAASLVVIWCGLFLCDLAYIGGYDGFAREDLAREFWYGRYSGLTRVVETGAMAALVVGFLGAGSSLITVLYIVAKGITANMRKIL